ncbi:MAG TPA: FtsX-like permease family protein [Candidatus Acidoferrales bacterium]|nr:FtsX-like permease family protein [Candidatus Acidoferrales bacterium]
MKAPDLAELALRNLREALLRNSLTTLGVAVGVASLVAMLSLGVGLQQFTSQRLSRSGLFNAVFVTPRSNLRDFGEPDRASPAPATPPRLLDEKARREIERLANVTEANPEIRFITDVRYAGNSYAAPVAGVPASARSDDAFTSMQGAFFSGPAASEAILQIEFAKELSNQPSTLLGKDLVLRYAQRQSLGAQTEAADAGTSAGRGAGGQAQASAGFSVVPREEKLRIVGIITAEPESGFGGFGRSRVFIPLALAETLRATEVSDLRDVLQGPGTDPTYISLTVRTKSSAQVASVEAAIKNMGFATFSLLDTTKNLRLFFAVIDLLLGIFGSLALAVATLGIINTLVMAILERRREIGVLKALGAADGDVKELFFAEAGVMGLSGGIAGVALGWFIGRLLTWGTDIYLHRQNLPSVNISAVPWWLAAGAIAFAVVVSLAAGIYPAARAAKLNPVEALRYE